MAATTIQRQPENKVDIPTGSQLEISWEEFEKEYLTREDQFKYEWVRGRVVKTRQAVNQYQYFILKNIEKLFLKLKAEGKVFGELIIETDIFFSKSIHRRPDMAWVSDEQFARMAYRQIQSPSFVIEVISDHDNADDLLDKIADYEEVGVKVVWLISPKLKQVHVYSEETKTICKGDMLCSAGSVLPAFQISANDIFKKPLPPV